MALEKPSRYHMLNEQLNTATHGVATVFSIVGTIFLVDKARQMHSSLHLTAYLIFGLSLVALFLCSTLYHAFTFTKARKIMHIFDHSAIFLLIAGSFTPYSLIALQGALGWSMYGVIWLIALVGIVYKMISMSKVNHVSKYSTIIYIGMGAVCILPMYDLYQTIGVLGIGLLISGCFVYLIGTIFYSLKQIKYTHVIWHLFVMMGAGCIYFSIFLTT
ncbi:PAQR family membrane homeostasis protein TrhA [Enterococcus casseliflavus]|uniref:PAQR family membrane homeostasis protein TrhA n=1 Tax=Enterococcus casseliflavus TaxID=37734 RepID=UPI00143324DB|nr:hemolysin III family protein [Enterococcus casseliflavus]NKD34141.1 hemolysin III family protein [Enterococcus casseliflavus]